MLRHGSLKDIMTILMQSFMEQSKVLKVSCSITVFIIFPTFRYFHGIYIARIHLQSDGVYPLNGFLNLSSVHAAEAGRKCTEVHNTQNKI